MDKIEMKISPFKLLAPLVVWFALVVVSPLQAQQVHPEEVRAIAKEAYIWGFALVDDYRIFNEYFIDETAPEFKGGVNVIGHNTRLYTPADTTIQTINSDTL
jgi:hypothetical protein